MHEHPRNFLSATTYSLSLKSNLWRPFAITLVSCLIFLGKVALNTLDLTIRGYRLLAAHSGEAPEGI
jgi:hypothetical protein